MSETKWSLRHYLELRPFTPKSLVLVLLGVMFVLIGINAILEPYTAIQERVLVMMIQLAPRTFWGGCSIVAGLLAIWSSRWPAMNDSWGFVALGVLSMWWACAYAIGSLLTGIGVAFSGALTWLSMCVLLWAISRLSDPVDLDLEQERPHPGEHLHLGRDDRLHRGDDDDA